MTGMRKESVILQEVGPRDGLQNEETVLAPEARAEIINLLADAGLSRIQIGSFVNPRLVPQMADTDKVFQHLKNKEQVRYSVLVLNHRGLEAALDAGLKHVEIFVSASETHSIKNSNMTVSKALAQAVGMIDLAISHGLGVTAGVMCALGCFYEGAVPVARVMDILAALEERGPSEICLADTAGMGKPEDTSALLCAVQDKFPTERIALHLHDTYGFGRANLIAALEMGIRRFDTSVAGLGGCPFIPGAKGNIPTEDVIETLESMNFRTGVDLGKVREVAAKLRRHLVR
ncbi:MAG: hydroxymethylglutaryl-CoA lyase [Thermodesulfobacteriota bacterium]